MTVDTSRYVPDFLIKIAGNKLRLGVTTDIISLSITETINQPDSFQFQLRGGHPKPGYFPSGGELALIDDSQFDPGRLVEIEMGYRKNRGLKLLGRITAISASYSESSAPTLLVQGQSRFDDLTRKHWRGPFTSITDTAVVEKIAKEFNLTPVVGELNTEHETLSFDGKTYASILMERARRLNFEVTVKEDRLIFEQPVYLKSSSPQMTLVWGRDIRSFSPRVSTSNMPTQVETRSSQTAIGRGKEPISAVVTADDVPASLGKVSGPQFVREWFKWADETKVLSVEHRFENTEEARAYSRARLEQAALDFVQASVSVNGNPQIKSRMVIELTGLGERFSGSYYITSTTHTINAGGYQTTFEVKRDGL